MVNQARLIVTGEDDIRQVCHQIIDQLTIVLPGKCAGIMLIISKGGCVEVDWQKMVARFTHMVEEKFDLVLAVGLLHFLNTKDVNSLISKMRVWTKQGGLNVIAVRMVQNYRQDLPHVFKHDELKEFYQEV